ncbi:metal ABC transporter solute-binding protein, Zn/Mn family [Thalassobacillus sp. C254]|uniref:metal ABC transporter solute-binding protein, Zn/Mn family n=1 Tax=Thalassobacillus sp. C254 TaxID=1225341 RepID=UPI0006D29D6D|nr:zinc ABC transporter substrate-binding protein [Thalassobacillus sp. C254]
MKKWLVLMKISTVVVAGCGETDEETVEEETVEEETVEEETVEEEQDTDTETEDNNEEADGNGEEIHVTTSFSVIGDFADNIVGDRGTVEYIVPIGEEPHEYEPVPSDFQKVSDSEVFYINGLDLEEWLGGLVENVGDVPIVELSEGVDPIALEGDDGHDLMLGYLQAQPLCILKIL